MDKLKTEELLDIKKRLLYGDITRIARKVGCHYNTANRVLNGRLGRKTDLAKLIIQTALETSIQNQKTYSVEQPNVMVA